MKRLSAALTLLLALYLTVSGVSGFGQEKMLAPTPPMGWSTWNHFHHAISDALVRAQTDAMVSSGMKDAGYVYVNIDGGWEGERDANGVLHPTSAFPDMKALGDYIHSKGLKFGLYTGPGPRTCAGAVASYGHEEQDAKMFASWGVDFLKYDLCSYREIMKAQSGGDIAKSDDLMKAAYEKMHRALLATGRPIVFSMCQYGLGSVWEWGPGVGGNLWRTSGDISDSYGRMTSIGFREAGLSKYAGPNHWNDPDFLEVGNGGMSPDEERTHFSLWAMLAAPLIAGNDLTQMSEETRSILLNKEVIAVDQDPLGKAGDRAYAEGPLEVWARPLAGGDMAVAMFNRLNGTVRITLRLPDVGWKGAAAARDLWTHKDIGVLRGSYTVAVPRHGVVMLRLSRAQ
ncbi:glycoside hydrolase family 27 protein [Edaphobacter acidisoli]|nr:glycoside hydrolase family 27 protein [Edaphobacter acidisoli]